MATKARRKQKLQEEKENELQNKTGIPEARSVLAEKVFKPLQAILDAYEARLKPNQTNEERLRAYPDPEIKKQRLDIFQQMVHVTKSLLDKQNMGINQTVLEPQRDKTKDMK